MLLYYNESVIYQVLDHWKLVLKKHVHILEDYSRDFDSMFVENRKRSRMVRSVDLIIYGPYMTDSDD